MPFPPYLIAHRGARNQAPENTLKSFKEALRLGADLIECDVHLSRDQELVIIHDESVDRTTNGFGLVRELSLAELQKLDAGNGEKIPSLEELLLWLDQEPSIGAILEIKGSLSIYPGISEAVTHAIEAHPLLLERVAVISFDYAVIEEVKDLNSKINTGILIGSVTDKILPNPIETARTLRADSIGLPLELVDPRQVTLAHAAGLSVFTWIVNTADELQRALQAQVDAVGSDDPGFIRAEMQKQFGIGPRAVSFSSFKK